MQVGGMVTGSKWIQYHSMANEINLNHKKEERGTVYTAILRRTMLLLQFRNRQTAPYYDHELRTRLGSLLVLVRVMHALEGCPQVTRLCNLEDVNASFIDTASLAALY